MPAQSSWWDEWGEDAFRAGLMYWMGQQQDSKTPNTYPVPLTPEDKRISDERWNVYNKGGTPNQQAVASAAKQFIAGMPTGPTNFQFVSPYLKGQSFAGGITLPKIDFSAFLNPASSTGTTKGTQGSAVSREDVIPAGSGTGERANGSWQAFNRTSGIDGGNTIPGARLPEDSYSRNVGLPGYPTGTAPRGNDPSMFGQDRMPDANGNAPGGQMQYADASKVWAAVKEELSKFDLGRLGSKAFIALATAKFGPLGAAAARGLLWGMGKMTGRDGEANPNPSGGGFIPGSFSGALP